MGIGIINLKLLLNNKDLLNKNKVKTIAIAYGSGISRGGLRSFNQMQKKEVSDRAIIASRPDQLRARLSDAIRSVIADKLAFTAPAITAKVNQGGSLFQAQFKYRQKNMEWRGTLTRSYYLQKVNLDEKIKIIGNASQVVPSPDARKIWTPLNKLRLSRSGWNNYVESNSSLIKDQFDLFGQ